MDRLWNRIKGELINDKRKLVMVTSLLAVALLLWGRLLLKDVPRTAVADPDQTAEAQAPSPRTTPAPQTDRPAVVLPERALSGYRNIFAADPIYFPQFHQDPTEPEKVKTAPKSTPDPVDENERQRAIRELVLAEAGRLTLQSTMLGRRDRALINGTLLEVGQSIHGFELKSVQTRQATLIRQGIEITLEM